MAWIEKRGEKHLVRWYEPDGRTASKLVRTKQEARTVKAQVESELLTGSYVAQAARQRPFGDYARELLETELHLERSTRYQHLRLYERWVAPHQIAKLELGEVDAAAIRRFFETLQGQGATSSSIARVRNLLGKVLRRAFQEGIIPRNPVAAVPAPKTERREIRILTPEEVQAVADAHPAPYRMMPLLSAWGTLRIGEVCALNEDAIDWDAGTIAVKRSIGTVGGKTYLKGPKTRAGRRVVRLPRWVMVELRQHVLEYSREGWLFTTPTGQFLSHITYHRYWRKALEAAGFAQPWPVPHDLRHTAVSLMIRTGADPKQIQERAGHATIKETYETYGHLFPGHDDALMEALEGYRPKDAEVIELGGHR